MTQDAQPALFGRPHPHGRRVVVTGQVGVDKKPFIEKVVELAAQRGKPARCFHVGDMMYAEAPDVRRGRILDLPLARLSQLRRSVFKDILAQIINTRR